MYDTIKGINISARIAVKPFIGKIYPHNFKGIWIINIWKTNMKKDVSDKNGLIFIFFLDKPKEIISGETIIKLSVSSLSKVGKTIWLYQIIRFIINKTIVIGAKYHLLFLNSTIKSFLLILNHAPNINGKDVLNPIPGQ